MPLNQAQRKAAVYALADFLKEEFGDTMEQLLGKAMKRMETRDLDNLLLRFAEAGLSLVSTALTFDFPAEVELPEPPKPAPPPQVLSAQQLANRLPVSASTKGPRRLTVPERKFVQDTWAAAIHMKDNPGFCFKSKVMLDTIRLLRVVSGETENV